MRDPTFDAKVETTREEAKRLLGLLSRLGSLRDGREDDPDGDVRSEAKMLLTLAAAGWKEPLPTHVLQYLYRLVTEEKAPPPRRGRRANTVRDLCIARVVARVVEHGIDATRNETTKLYPSACSIVAEILGSLRVNLTERAVEEVWSRMRDRVSADDLPRTIRLDPAYRARVEAFLRSDVPDK
jgi:hypothetical protein